LVETTGVYKFAYQNLWIKKSRTLLALIGVIIAIVGVVGLISISAGLRENITGILTQIQGVVVLQDGAVDDVFSIVDMKRAAEIEKFAEVRIVAPSVGGFITSLGGKAHELRAAPFGGALPFFGLDPAKNSQLVKGSLYNPPITRGRFLNNNDKNAVVVGKPVAEEFKINVGTTLDINGISMKVVGIYSTGSNFVDRAVMIPIEPARKFRSLQDDQAASFYVELKDPNDAEKVASKINFRYEDELKADTGAGFGEQAGSILSSLDAFFFTVSMIAILVGAIGILNTMLMSVIERTKEFGILKALGWTAKDIQKLVLFESMFMSVIGGIIGIIVGSIIVVLLGSFLGFPGLVTSDLVLLAFVLSIGLGVFGGYYPAHRAAKMDPVEAIHYE